MDRTELTDQIYDSLMENVGMSDEHTTFPIDEIRESVVNSESGTIRITFKSGDQFWIQITRMSTVKWP